MKFGILYNVDYHADVHGPPHQYYADIVQQIADVEQLGYHSAWFGEHHYEKFSFAAPSLMVMAAAAATSVIKLGTGVSTLPLHHPIRLAEEYAMLDQLTGGRFEWGIGRGFLKTGYDVLGVDESESMARYRESLDVILEAWSTEKPFNHDGQFWDIRDYECFPKPFQSPTPPIFASAASTPESYVWTGQRGLNLGIALFLPQQEMVREGVAKYRAALQEQGVDPADREVLGVMQMYCGETEADARSGWEYTSNYLSFFSMIDRKNPHRAEDYEAYKAAYAEGAPAMDRVPYDVFDENRLALIGTPEQIVEKIKWIQEYYAAPDILMLEVSHGGIRPEHASRTLELFAREVMPEFS